MFVLRVNAGCYSVYNPVEVKSQSNNEREAVFCFNAYDKLFSIVTRNLIHNEFIEDIKFALDKANIQVNADHPLLKIIDKVHNYTNLCDYMSITKEITPTLLNPLALDSVSAAIENDSTNILKFCGVLNLQAETINELIDITSKLLFGLKFDIVREAILNLVNYTVDNGHWYINSIETAIVNFGNLSMLFYDIKPDENGNKVIDY